MRTTVFGQQLGRLEVDSEVEIPEASGFAAAINERSAFSQTERAGFGKGRERFPVCGAATAESTPPRKRSVFEFQVVESLAAGWSAGRHPNYRRRLSRDLGSRSSTAAIESMIRQLLARDRVLAARKLIDAVPSEGASDESLRRLRIVLAEPVVRRRLPAQVEGSRNIDWLRRNARNYSGKWVALADGTFLAADESLALLRRRLRELAPKIKPFLHRL